MIIYPFPAQELDDKTLDKQIKAVAQTLCNVHHKIALVSVNYRLRNPRYKDSFDSIYTEETKHIPLPQSVPVNAVYYLEWASECRANYLKLIEMGKEACEEYSYRKGKHLYHFDYELNEDEYVGDSFIKHKLQDVIDWACYNVPDFSACAVSFSPFPACIPKKYLWEPITPLDKALANGEFYKNEVNHIVASYRNYYQAKLNQQLKSYVTMSYESEPYVKKFMELSKWTRRKKPEWLTI